MFINGLNPTQDGFRADGDLDDDEDAGGHSLLDTIQSAINRKSAIQGNLEYFDKDKNKKYEVKEGTLPFFMHRERGLLLDEPEFLIDENPISASILSTTLTLMHCGREQQKKGDYIFFYLPKIEYSREAKFWREFFDYASSLINELDSNKIKAIMLVESLPMAMDMENILFSLGKYAAGLNAARWDLKASVLEFIMTHSELVWPDRFDVNVSTTPFMVSIFKKLVAVCIKHNGVPIGGMATALPDKDEEVNIMAAKSIVSDKTWEAENGFLRGWVAHIYHMKTAAMPFKNLRDSGWLPKEEMKNPELYPLDNLNLKPDGSLTQEGTRRNVRTIIEYLEGWFNGRGAKGIDSLEGIPGKRPALMEDLATARISIAQTAQRIIHNSVCEDTGNSHDKDFVVEIFNSEFDNIVSLRPESKISYTRAKNLGLQWLDNYINLDFRPLGTFDKNLF
jgi:malate synthase